MTQDSGHPNKLKFPQTWYNQTIRESLKMCTKVPARTSKRADDKYGVDHVTMLTLLSIKKPTRNRH